MGVRTVKALLLLYKHPGRDVHDRPTVAVRTAKRGQEVELTTEEEERLDGVKGALLEPGQTSADAKTAMQEASDLYRGRRGDTDAFARATAVRRAARADSGIERVDMDASEASVGELAAWISAEHPTVGDTIELAQGDAEVAQKVLEAETAATGGDPRSTVVKALHKIIG